MFRCGQDLLVGKPDLVFVEFAVNDKPRDETGVMRSMEGIVRQILLTSPAADIIFLYTLEKAMSEFYDRGELPPTVQMHQRVATHHGIQALNLGRAIWEEIHTGNATWQEMLPDNTHPSNQGFAINTAQIRAFLEAHRNDAAAGPREVPPLTVDPLEQAHLVEVTGVDAPAGGETTRSRASTSRIRSQLQRRALNCIIPSRARPSGCSG